MPMNSEGMPVLSTPSCWEASCHVHDESQTVLGVLDVTESLAEVDRQLLANRGKVFLLALTAVLASSFIIGLAFHRLVGKSRLHELCEYRRGKPATRCIPAHALGLIKADEDRNDEVRREANEPGVLLIIGCACLAGDRTFQSTQFGRRAALYHTFHHGRDLVGRHRIKDLITGINQFGFFLIEPAC